MNYKILWNALKMSKNNYLFILMCLFGLNACASKMDIQVEKPSTIIEPMKTDNIKPIISNDWQNWNLVIVTLDKDKKPSDKAEVSLLKPVKLTKEKSPEINIEESIQEDMVSRVIRIRCSDNMVTQKFDNVNQLKGWAIQMTCFKQSYYFIVNPTNKQ